ncbi:TPA: hypothetical protein TVE77_000732 [Streptococcus equi subsp. zooepidemicus]|uniref:Phage protein n=1 Tax=Streptococcus equi subsp. ruminatorum CECT 5772 TaxID=1051981 RepID=A0A922T4Q8_9STRE|nr:hypothetical protein [Streptococcus equi]QBX24288.1 hypothetical protein Javan182_0018 [Streptococcus phage Javan182]KED05290.1 hypothetical protein CECT5772_00606 [Streptococcus equi subsp. ruminatorum CECT 5772]MCD3386910.1 hypothetical protein [Streptococcus equi subsp. zooepidemicus]MCD3410364.1 hypothetical protein [Streptococcus equi subsp. zooepidemicus]MCD3435621.1 hypothetical protein [Streptococcus equi subsp. zooepidemicus]
MIELTIKKYLDEHLDVPSFFEHQKDEPARFIILEKTSGAKQNHLLSSTFAFKSYAESLYEAALLNDKVKQVIEQLDVLPQVSGVHLNADYNFTDTATKRYRYQAVFDINHY